MCDVSLPLHGKKAKKVLTSVSAYAIMDMPLNETFIETKKRNGVFYYDKEQTA